MVTLPTRSGSRTVVDPRRQRSDAARVLLIGGTSLVGKSTLGHSLARRFGWACRSTDTLARHPGRPWRAKPEAVPAHVAEHFGTLGTDELLQAVRAHYEAMWPTLVEPLIARSAEARSEPGLVLEGSAVLPAEAATLDGPVAAAWIVASEGLLRGRALAESGYAGLSPDERDLVDAFSARARAFDAFIREETLRLSLPVVDLGDGLTDEDLQEAYLSVARAPRGRAGPS